MKETERVQGVEGVLTDREAETEESGKGARGDSMKYSWTRD